MTTSRQKPTRGGAGRALAWVLCVAALGFVVHAVPIYDRCDDPATTGQAGRPPARLRVLRDTDGCRMDRADGAIRLSASECTQLRCEPGLVSVARSVRPWTLALLPLVYLFATLASAVRWRALLGVARVRLGVGEAFRITLESLAAGVVLPGGIGGDAMRVAFVARRGAPLGTIVAAVLLDRVIGLVTLSGLAVALAVILHGATGPAVAVLAAIPVAFILGIVVVRHLPPAVSRLLTSGWVARVARHPIEYLCAPEAPRAMTVAVLVSGFVSASYLVAIRCILSGLGAAPSEERWVYMGATMAGIVGAVPLLPGGWGTSDAAFVFFLGRAGLVASIALAASLLHRLLGYSCALVGAISYLLRQHGGGTPTHPHPTRVARPGGRSR